MSKKMDPEDKTLKDKTFIPISKEGMFSTRNGWRVTAANPQVANAEMGSDSPNEYSPPSSVIIADLRNMRLDEIIDHLPFDTRDREIKNHPSNDNFSMEAQGEEMSDIEDEEQQQLDDPDAFSLEEESDKTDAKRASPR